MRHGKPLGVFRAIDVDRPSWAQFGFLSDEANFEAAAHISRETGFRWVLGLFSLRHDTPVSDRMRDVRAALDEAGLTPYLVGMCYSEEWYGAFKSGGLAHIDGMSGRHETAEGILSGAQMIHAWVGWQHAAMKAALPGVPIVWIDTYVNDDLSFGPWWYQPVPSGVDVLALECYVSAGSTWAADAEPFLRHAVATRREPIALVIQGFRADGDPLWHVGPTADTARGTAAWLAHPRVISGWVFDWASRGPDLTGLQHLDCPPLNAAMGVDA